MRGFAVMTALGVAMSAVGGAAAQEAGNAITIYNEDLALVRQTRTLDINRGESVIAFPDVTARIQPETAAINAAGLTVLEQNFDFDLLSPEKLLEKAVGQTVRIVRINPGNGQEISEVAEVLSVNNGAVLKIGDRIEVLRSDGMPTRVIFDKIPEDLKAKPTLTMTVNSSQAGRRPVELSYLSGGLSWKADYVGVFDDAKNELELKGWITLTNNSGIAFTNALTQLVAGDVNRARDAVQPMAEMMVTARAAPASAKAQQEAFGDYHLYTLPRPTTIRNNQTKQVSLLEAPKVRASKLYRYDANGFFSMEQPANVDVRVMFKNDTGAGLGLPLPGGIVRLYGRDSQNRTQFLGEDRINHTADGLDVNLQMGKAFDVTVLPTLLNQERISDRVAELQIRYRFRNAKPDAVTVDLRQRGLYGRWQITQASLKHERLDAQTAGWKVTIPAKGETILTFTARVGD
jgi:hypothetical protein